MRTGERVDDDSVGHTCSRPICSCCACNSKRRRSNKRQATVSGERRAKKCRLTTKNTVLFLLLLLLCGCGGSALLPELPVQLNRKTTEIARRATNIPGALSHCLPAPDQARPSVARVPRATEIASTEISCIDSGEAKQNEGRTDHLRLRSVS